MSRLLLPHHREQLVASAIAEDVWTERGVFSVEVKAELEPLGFGRSLHVVPTLVFPIHGVVPGQPPWYVHRPDVPQIKDGRPRKYMIPAGRRMSLDIHPRVRANLTNPEFPLVVTEGQKKVDALVSAGARAVAGVIGVWSWRGRNDHDGLAMLADWEFIALKEGRQVYVVFDSDVMLKEPVRLAMERMGKALERMGATVAYVYLPAGDGGAKVGADDFLAAGHSLEDVVSLASSTLRAPSMSVGGCGGAEPRATVQHPPAIAAEEDILGRFASDVLRLGHTGEERACKVLYLSVTSRLLPKIVSCVMKGTSAAGKSATVDRVLLFFPEEAFYSLSGMSERFLVYDEEPIAHRMLILHEAAGMSGDHATYLIRTLLSEGRLVHGTVEATPDGLQAMRVIRDGPTGLITTTTAVNLHAENETRLISIPADDTTGQTGAVMDVVAAAAAAATAPDNGAAINMDGWHTLQLWLADGERRVRVPFAKTLARLIPPLAVRLRRDFGSLLGLVSAHALLHRATRVVDEHGIVATIDDYAAVRELVVDLISDGIGATVSEQTRATVRAVEALANGGSHVSNAQLVEKLKLDKSTVSRRVRVAIEKGYLINDEDRRGKPAKLKTADALPDDVVILPTVETLEEGLEKDCCTVARGSAPPHTPNDIDVLREPSCNRPEHRRSDWAMPNAAMWICGDCHPPTPAMADRVRRRAAA